MAMIIIVMPMVVIGLDDVETVEAKAERLAGIEGKLAQLVAHGCGPSGLGEAHRGEPLANGEDAIADDIELEVLAPAGDALLDEQRTCVRRHGIEVLRAADEDDARPPVAAMRLGDERRFGRDRREQAHITGDPGARGGDAAGAQQPGRHDLVLCRHAGSVWVQHSCTRRVEDAGQAQRQLGVRLQHHQIDVVHLPAGLQDDLLGDHIVHHEAALPEDGEDLEQHWARNGGNATDEQEADPHRGAVTADVVARPREGSRPGCTAALQM
jgi:hypothetical protein